MTSTMLDFHHVVYAISSTAILPCHDRFEHILYYTINSQFPGLLLSYAWTKIKGGRSSQHCQDTLKKLMRALRWAAAVFTNDRMTL